MASFLETVKACAGEDQLTNAKSCLKLADEVAQYSPRLAASLREVGEAMFDLQYLASDMLRTMEPNGDNS